MDAAQLGSFMGEAGAQCGGVVTKSGGKRISATWLGV